MSPRAPRARLSLIKVCQIPPHAFVEPHIALVTDEDAALGSPLKRR